jgi:hypothetical protein
MAQDTHAEHGHDDEHAHLEDHHHHEGPIAHTEVVPVGSTEDTFLLSVLSLCFVFLFGTIGNWSFNVKADAHHAEGVEHEHTFVEKGTPGTPPAAHDVAPAHEGAPVAPATTPAGTTEGSATTDPHAPATIAPNAAPGSVPGNEGTNPANPATLAPVAPEQPATTEAHH